MENAKGKKKRKNGREEKDGKKYKTFPRLVIHGKLRWKTQGIHFPFVIHGKVKGKWKENKINKKKQPVTSIFCN